MEMRDETGKDRKKVVFLNKNNRNNIYIFIYVYIYIYIKKRCSYSLKKRHASPKKERKKWSSNGMKTKRKVRGSF